MSAGLAVVTNNEPRLHSIRFSRDLEPIQLKPGANLVPRADWAQAEKIRVVQVALEEGRLVVGGSVPADGLQGLDEAKAIALIGETLDLAALRAWARLEQRDGVARALDRQLAKIEQQAAPAKQKQ